jgi:hypothetical protein
LLAALADYTTALDLRRDVPLDYAQTLNNRAVLLRDLAGLPNEDRRGRLLAALADYTTALDLLRDVPLDYAQTLNNRANLLRDLAGLPNEDRRGRLLAALADYTTALDLLRDVPLAYAMTQFNIAILYLEAEIRDNKQAVSYFWAANRGFLATQHQPYYEGSQNALRQVKSQLGAVFDSLWNEVVGVPQPDWLANATPQSGPADLQQLADSLIAWVQTPDWGTSQAYLEAHQAELLTEAAEGVLQMLIQMNPGEETLPEHLTLLRAARANGIAAAYQARGGNSGLEVLQQLLNAFVEIPNPQAMTAFAAQVPAPLLDALEQVIEQVILPQVAGEQAADLRRRLADLRAARG